MSHAAEGAARPSRARLLAPPAMGAHDHPQAADVDQPGLRKPSRYRCRSPGRIRVDARRIRVPASYVMPALREGLTLSLPIVLTRIGLPWESRAKLLGALIVEARRGIGYAVRHLAGL